MFDPRRWRATVKDWMVIFGGYIIRAIRSNDVQAGGQLAVYAALATGLVIWGAYMVVLVKAIVGL